MRPLLAVASREWLGARRYLLVAVVFGVFPILLSLVPPLRPAGGWGWLLLPLAEGLALSLGVGLAIGLGGSTVAREVDDGRLAFLLSRPISTRAIWFGKVITSWGVAAAAFAITLAPTRILMTLGVYEGADFAGTPFPPGLDLAVMGGLLLILLLANWISLMVRARSGWMALDLLGAALLALIATMIWRRLTDVGEIWLLQVLAVVAAVALVVALLGAGERQLARSTGSAPGLPGDGAGDLGDVDSLRGGGRSLHPLGGEGRR
ncbi:MAG: hypothetical protein P1V51_13045 [Deltaproteobacteria bacterium]|nr:hypothetical protein [Deltaproteobacteria bacterium]